jgi:hypothetical protein
MLDPERLSAANHYYSFRFATTFRTTLSYRSQQIQQSTRVLNFNIFIKPNIVERSGNLLYESETEGFIQSS